MFESGAIMMYLAEKSGFRFMPADMAARYDVIQWLMFQMANVGPMLGQAHHFLRFAPEKLPYAMKRYSVEARRIYGVLNGQLENREFICGEYSIADIATWPWIRRHDYQEIELADFPNVKRWFAAMEARPAVQRGLKVPS